METKRYRTAPVHSVPPSNMLQFMVGVNRPSSKELEGIGRAEKYKLLKANSVKRKDEIKAWIRAHGLDTEVFKIFDRVFSQGNLAIGDWWYNLQGWQIFDNLYRFQTDGDDAGNQIHNKIWDRDT